MGQGATGSTLSAIDLISTPVPLLPELGLVTHVGLSGDDPLAGRHLAERYDVLLSSYDPAGSLLGRSSLGEIGAGERRLYAVSDLAGPAGCTTNRLAVVHRVPLSLVSDEPVPTGVDQETFALYRSVVQLSRPGGGNGSVVYETPPYLNDSRRSSRRSSALMFTSKVFVGHGADTHVCLLHHSLDPDYRAEAAVRFLAFDEAGQVIGRAERTVGPFSVEVLSLSSVLPASAHDRPEPVSVVAWSRDAALLFLVVQTTDEPASVSVEHTHPPQTYLLPTDPAVRQRVKAAAIDAWDERWATGA